MGVGFLQFPSVFEKLHPTMFVHKSLVALGFIGDCFPGHLMRALRTQILTLKDLEEKTLGGEIPFEWKVLSDRFTTGGAVHQRTTPKAVPQQTIWHARYPEQKTTGTRPAPKRTHLAFLGFSVYCRCFLHFCILSFGFVCSQATCANRLGTTHMNSGQAQLAPEDTHSWRVAIRKPSMCKAPLLWESAVVSHMLTTQIKRRPGP